MRKQYKILLPLFLIITLFFSLTQSVSTTHADSTAGFSLLNSANAQARGLTNWSSTNEKTSFNIAYTSGEMDPGWSNSEGDSDASINDYGNTCFQVPWGNTFVLNTTLKITGSSTTNNLVTLRIDFNEARGNTWTGNDYDNMSSRKVYVDGKLYDTTGPTLDLPAGTHQISLQYTNNDDSNTAHETLQDHTDLEFVNIDSNKQNVGVELTNTKEFVSPYTLTAKQNSDSSVDLNWDPLPDYQPWNYQLELATGDNDTPQTIPSKSTVKVLNVYPDGTDKGTETYTDKNGNQQTLYKSELLKEWMEAPNSESPNGYGKGLISVDPVNISTFNADPDSYLKNPDGTYKYDVVMFGSWDGNGTYSKQSDLSDSAESSMEIFLKSGRGVLLGHDTAAMNFSHDNFVKIAINYLGLTVSNTIPVYGDSKVVIMKKGLFTNYPWNIGDVGSVLNIPMTHTYGEFTSSDVWLQFQNNTWAPGDNEISGAMVNSTGTNEFYLTSKNNIAMIQTGHSCGQATADEQKILANTLFYLSQLTQSTSWTDHSATDTTGPNTPDLNSAYYDPSSKSVSIFGSWAGTTDNGTTSKYKVVATGQNDGAKVVSNEVPITTTSGFDHYAINADNNSTASYNPANTYTKINTNSNGVATLSNVDYSNSKYVHIFAIDKNGNASSARNIAIDNPTTTVDNGFVQGSENIDNNIVSNSTSPFQTTKDIVIKSNDVLNQDSLVLPSGVQSYNYSSDGKTLTIKWLPTGNGTFNFSIKNNLGFQINHTEYVSNYISPQYIFFTSAINKQIKNDSSTDKTSTANAQVSLNGESQTTNINNNLQYLRLGNLRYSDTDVNSKLNISGTSLTNGNHNISLLNKNNWTNTSLGTTDALYTSPDLTSVTNATSTQIENIKPLNYEFEINNKFAAQIPADAYKGTYTGKITYSLSE